MNDKNIANQKRMEYYEVMEKPGFLYQKYLNLIFGGLVLAGFYYLGLKHYLLFHSIVESFSMVVAIGIFIIAWNSRRFLENHYLLFIGIAYVFIALIDLLHLLAYKGMGVFGPAFPSPNLQTQLWIGARYLQAVTLLAAPLFLTRKIKTNLVFFDYAAAVGLLLFSIFYLRIFPVTYIDGLGLTAFKKISEYIISLMLAGSAIFLFKKRWLLDKNVYLLITFSIFFTIASELAFSDYVSVFGVANIIGHLLRIVAIYLMYEAIVATGFKKPFSILFRELKQKEEVLLKAKNEWETTFDSVPDLIAIIDPNHKIARLNKPMAARLGLEPKQCIGLPCYEAVHGLTGPIASCPHARSLADGKEHVQEVFEPRLDGYFLVSTTPLYNKKGQILGCVHMARDITERKKTEEKLSYLASFPQLNMNPIIEIEPGTGITYMNPAAETLFPRLRKELFNSALLAGINHDENHASRETLYENKAWLQSIASLPEGKIRIYHTDITERKKWEEELKETQNYLESLIGYANAPIIVWDKNNKITKFNRAFEYMTGYTANDVIGQDLSILFPPESRQMALEEIAKTTAGKFLHSVEIPILRKNGKTKIALWNSANIYDKDGQTLMATIAQGQDITARIQLEKRVSAHARYLEHEKVKSEAILSSIGHGIVAIDNERKTLFSNEGFENITGYSKKELLGQDITQFIRLEDEKGIEISAERRPIRSVLLSGKKTNSNSVFSFNCIRKDGSKIPVAITTTPIILDNKVIGAIEVYRDITREKQIDRAKTEFVSLASHQLRTPLASINLAAEMLMNGIAGELSKEQRKYLRTIRGSIKEMAELIETLLNVSRIESGALTINPEPTSLPNFITASLKDFSIQIEDKRLNLIKEFDQDIPILNIDRKLMQLILDNLISNAIKYTKEKDTISVTAKKSRHAVVISVSDTGYGIPSHQHSQIFTKLFRADNHLKSQTKGTGLGLYIVKACVAQYGGKVWFESEENKGTTFYVTVPLIGMKKRDKVQQNLFPVTL